MNKHIKIIDFLRGIAALLVVLLHFGNGGLPTIKNNGLDNFYYYGLFGVQIFFVISGFIIPYSLYKSNYNIRYYFKNVLRRFMRIDPPSYLSMLMVIGIYYSAFVVINRPINGMVWPGMDFKTIIANMTYTVDYLHTDWFNPVFWTLAIEFQFYLIIGLVFPLLFAKNKIIIIALLFAFLGLYWIPVRYFFTYSSFFVIGIILFLDREQIINKSTFYLLLIISLLVCYFQTGLTQFCFALFAAVFIKYFNFSSKVTNHLGKISYSLYLTHLPVGWVAEIVLKKYLFLPTTNLEKNLILCFFVLLAILFATLFYWTIEKYFLALSKRVKWA